MRLTCEEARQRLGPLLADDLGAPERRVLEEHLLTCAPCGADAARVRGALDVLAADDVPDPGALYWASFGRRLRSRIAAGRRRSFVYRVAAVLAAGVLLVLAGRLLRHGGQGPGEPPIASLHEPAAAQSPVSTPGDEGVRAERPRPPRGPEGTAGTPRRAPSVEEAEARLNEALRRAIEEGQDPGEIEAILDDITPADPLEGTDPAGDPSDDGLEPLG